VKNVPHPLRSHPTDLPKRSTTRTIITHTSHIASLFGSEECVKLLLAAGARVDAINVEDGTSALHDAAAGGYARILRLLVDAAERQLDWRGVGAAAPAGAGDSAGAAAAAAADGEEEEEEEGANADALSQPAAAPAAPAAAGAATPAVVTAFINLRDLEGETALHTAARGNHLGCVELLLALGADPLIAANDGGSLAVGEAEDDDVVAVLQAAMEAAEAAGGGGGGGGGAVGEAER